MIEPARGGLKRAVIYLRVSSKGQVDTDYDPEGLSLPGQREACRGKAAELGAEVIEEYVDAGESATSADHRDNFRRMLARIKQRQDVDYVIVYKINRFARNRRDDANALFDIHSAGATLVSARENVDDTPVGRLLHGILATIAEFESANDAIEIRRCVLRKVEQGGTHGPAPLGYLNVVEDVDGRRINTVAIDPERAPLVRWAFEQFATGEWTLASLLEELHELGLRFRPTPKKPTRPLARASLNRLLRNPYYYGMVRFKEALYPGRHEPLISKAVFDKVQAVLDSHRRGEKRRTHDHYLKSTLVCGHCRSRMCVMNARGKTGARYLYFFCVGRHQRRTGCAMRYVLADEVAERLVEVYRQIRLEPERADTLKEGIKAQLAERREHAGAERKSLERLLARLGRKRQKLWDSYSEGDLPRGFFKKEQAKINDETEAAEKRLKVTQLEFRAIEQALERCLQIISNPYEAYRDAPAKVRRLLNQFFFERVEVFDNLPLKVYFRSEVGTVMRAGIELTPLTSAEDEPADELVYPEIGRRARREERTNPDLVFSRPGFERDTIGGERGI